MNPLADLRVLDLSNGVAGAYCSKLFADYGADVIVVEPPSGGHPFRHQGPFVHGQPHPETSALWLYLSTNKRSVTLDIGSGQGQQILHRMVEEAHIIVESFPPGHLEDLGLGFETLRAIKRRIVLVSITPYGQRGPRAGWLATDFTSLASGGQLAPACKPGERPQAPAERLAEYQAGLQAFAAAAVAAFNADALEVPQHVDIATQECLASTLEAGMAWWAFAQGQPPSSPPTGEITPFENPQSGVHERFRVDQPVAGPLTQPGPPFRMSGIEWQAGRAPLLGEHNTDVYCGELGLSQQEMERLRAEGVV